MKKSDIVIVSIDEQLGIDVSKRLASVLKKTFVNMDDIIEFNLLSTDEIRVRLGEEFLIRAEEEMFKKVAEYEKAVFYIKADTFMANENYKYLEKAKIIYVKDKNIFCDISLKKKDLEECNQKAIIHNSISFYLSKVCAYVVEEKQDIEDIVKDILKLIKGA